MGQDHRVFEIDYM